MRKVNVFLFTILVAMSLSGNSFAGAKGTYPVVVADNFFKGSLGSARNSADFTQYIGCTYYGTSGNCVAKDSAGVFKACSTSNADHLAAIASMNNDTYMHVWFDPGTGQCTSFQVINWSISPPKDL